MSEHINGWLTAYFDGQLGERRIQKVEAHLRECEECRQELERLTSLRNLLQENPEASDLTAPERFAAQVGLRLQPRPTRPPLQRALSAAWISVPVLMLLIWAFTQTLFTLTGLTELALDIGLLNNVAKFFPPTTHSSLLDGIPWHVGILLATGLISLSWLASWWISQQGKLQQKKTE
jgi:predicted anti-sigma-YlaC factor YlaD